MMTEYVEFVRGLMYSMTPDDTTDIIKSSPTCVQINHGVQYYLYLESKGLVQLNCDPSVYGGLNHPLVKRVSNEIVVKMAADPITAGFFQLDDPAKQVLASIVAANVVGGVQYVMPIEWIADRDITSIFNISSTLH